VVVDRDHGVLLVHKMTVEPDLHASLLHPVLPGRAV
jgi:hypothetical protein